MGYGGLTSPIWVISWRSVLLVKEIRVPGENQSFTADFTIKGGGYQSTPKNFIDLPQVTDKLYHIKWYWGWRAPTYPENPINLPQVTDKLYHIKLYWGWRAPKYPENPINLPQVTDKLYHIKLYWWWRAPKYPENPINLPQVTDKLCHIKLYWVYLPMRVSEWLLFNDMSNLATVRISYISMIR